MSKIKHECKKLKMIIYNTLIYNEWTPPLLVELVIYLFSFSRRGFRAQHAKTWMTVYL